MSHQNLVLFAIITIALSGCATLNREECVNADWHMIGYRDGDNGEAASRIEEHQEACAEFGIRPNYSDYVQGRQQGIASYCTDANGFNQGRRGQHYLGVCPKSSEQDFLFGYQEGIRLHRAEQAKHETANRLYQLERKLDRLRDDIRDRKHKLNAPQTPANQHSELNDQLDHLRNKKRRTKNKIRRLEHELADRVSHFNWLRIQYER